MRGVMPEVAALPGRGASEEVSKRKSLPQPAQSRFIAAGGFLGLGAEAPRDGGDVIQKGLVTRSRIGVGPVVATVRGKKARRGCFTDLLVCPLEIEVPCSVGGRQDANA